MRIMFKIKSDACFKSGIADTEYALQKTCKSIVTLFEMLVKQTKVQNLSKLKSKKSLQLKAKIKNNKIYNDDEEITSAYFIKTEEIAASGSPPGIEDVIEGTLASVGGIKQIKSCIERYGPIYKYCVALNAASDNNIVKSQYGLRGGNNEWKIGH